MKHSTETKPSDGKGAGFHPAPRGKVSSAQDGILVSVRDGSADKALSWDVAHQGVNPRFAEELELGSSTSLGITLTTGLFAILVPGLLLAQHFCSKRNKEKNPELIIEKSFLQRAEKLFVSPYYLLSIYLTCLKPSLMSKEQVGWKGFL